MPRPDQSLRTYTLAAPTGGIDGVSTLFDMPENRAIDIVDGVCEPYGIRSRNDARSTYLSVTGSSSQPAGTAGELIAADGSSDPFVIMRDRFKEANTDTARTGSLTITSEYWRYVQYKYRIFAVNGTDQPFDWQGDGNNAAATSWSGTSLTITDLWNVSTYAGELVFLEKGTFGWWVPTDAIGAITGAMTFYDIQEYSSKGGQLCDLAQLSFGTDNFTSQYMCFLSDQGELFVYYGDTPTDMSILGRFDLSPPVGEGLHAFVPVEGDLFVITTTGMISVKELVRGEPREQYTLSAPFEKQWLETVGLATTDYQGIWYPDRNYVLIVKLSAAGTTALCYNRTTQGWSTFEIINGAGTHSSWFYSKAARSVVLVLGVAANYPMIYFDPPDSVAPDSDYVELLIKHSFSSLGTSKDVKKSLLQIKPHIEIEGDAAYTPAQVEIFIDKDYEVSDSYVAGSGTALGLVFADGKSVWSKKKDCIGEGEVFSIVLKIDFWESGTAAPWARVRYLGSTLYFREDGEA